MDVYDQFDKATGMLEAWVILIEGDYCARVVLKHGGQLTAYCQVWGFPMAKGIARGGNYDRATAGVESAFAKIQAREDGVLSCDPRREEQLLRLQSLIANTRENDGTHWFNRLEQAGVTVARVI